MSLLLSGAKTMTFAGTEMQCLEIYTGEAYTIGLQFTDSGGNAVNASGWTLGTGAKFYTVDNVTYSALGQDEVILGNITLDSPQPTANAYSNLTAAFSSPSTGVGYLFIPPEIADGSGSPNPTPVPALNQGKATPESILVIVTLSVTRPNVTSSQDDVQKTPLGLIVRYQ
jgi:hypothetical protein